MKVLFLDFDGVLNNKQHFLATKDVKVRGAESLNDADLFAMMRDVAPHHMWILGYIMKQIPDLQIVVSSSWRLHYHLESFKDLFGFFKLDGDRILDKTSKKLSSERHNEIHWWLEDHPEVKQWLALDDHSIFNLDDPDINNQHLTDGWVGVTMHDAFKIIMHFNPNYKEPELYI